MQNIFETQVQGSFPYVVRSTQNNGIRGYIIENEQFANDKDTLSFAQDTFTVFYQKDYYFTGNKIKILKPLFKKSSNILRFMTTCFQQSLHAFTWGTGSTVDTIAQTVIHLPTKDGHIDFDFMESFIAELEAQRIAELEAQRIAELEAYLSVTGLKDYTLTEEEERIIADYQANRIDLKDYSFASIFNNIKQGRRLKKDDQLEGEIPFVMAGVTNTGVVGYVSNPVAEFPKNSITVDIFGNTFYRNYNFGAGDDTGVYWNDEAMYTKEQMLYFAGAIQRSLHGKFSFGEKLRSSQSYDFKMFLPSKQDKPDLEKISNLISAIQKLVIKDVVLYADRKIAGTKTVIGDGHVNQQ